MRLVYMVCGWAAGLALAANNPSDTLAPFWLLLAVAALVGLWLAWPNRPQRWLLLALVALAFGGLRYTLMPQGSAVSAYNMVGGLTLEGIITAEPQPSDTRLLLRIETESLTRAGQTIPTSGLVLVQTARETAAAYGDRIAATGLLVTPPRFDTFNYADYLARSGIYSIMTDASVTVLASDAGSPLYAALLTVKQRARDLIAAALPDPFAALLIGILLGDESGIAPEIETAFSAVGASHVVAISGFNMAVLSGVLMALLARFRVPRWLAALTGIGVVALYTLLVGANAAVVRAAVMSSVLVIGTLIRRKTFVPASLAFAALLLTTINPTALWDVGFQLSFMATLGLALFATPLSRRFDRWLRRALPPRAAALTGDLIGEPLAVSLAAQLFALPLIVLYFGRLSLVSLPVNLLIGPAQPPLLLVGSAAVLLAFALPALAQLIFWVALLLLGWTIAVVRLFAALPFADTAFSADPRLIILFFIAMIGGALMQAAQPGWLTRAAVFVRQRSTLAASAASGAALAALLFAFWFSRPDGLLHVWFLDMGHSQAAFVTTPGGAHLLFDGGRYPSRLLTALGDRMPFYDRDIELLVISQPDENDYSALAAVLRRYHIGLALTNGHPNQSEAYKALLDQLQSAEQAVVRAGYTLTTSDGVLIEVLHPQRLPEPASSLDENTLTLRLTYGDLSFLFSSDLSRDGQQALLNAGQWPLAAVMTLPRHGGARSLDTAFLEAAQPQLVVLQSDLANRLGDPDGDTLALLGSTPLLRTDQAGSVHLWTDGASLWTDSHW